MWMLIKEMMTTPVKKVPEWYTVKETADFLVQNDITGVPVVNKAGEMVGIVTERDLIRYCLPSYLELLGDVPYLPDTNFIRSIKQEEDHAISELMTVDVITVQDDATMTQVAALMVAKHLKRIPILHGEELIGIISRKDLVRLISKAKK